MLYHLLKFITIHQGPIVAGIKHGVRLSQSSLGTIPNTHLFVLLHQ